MGPVSRNLHLITLSGYYSSGAGGKNNDGDNVLKWFEKPKQVVYSENLFLAEEKVN